jgi:hypothetical protein
MRVIILVQNSCFMFVNFRFVRCIFGMIYLMQMCNNILDGWMDGWMAGWLVCVAGWLVCVAGYVFSFLNCLFVMDSCDCRHTVLY